MLSCEEGHGRFVTRLDCVVTCDPFREPTFDAPYQCFTRAAQLGHPWPVLRSAMQVAQRGNGFVRHMPDSFEEVLVQLSPLDRVPHRREYTVRRRGNGVLDAFRHVRARARCEELESSRIV